MGASLTLNNVQPYTNGTYFVKVTSGSLVGYSRQSATLTVGYPLTTSVQGAGRVYKDPEQTCVAQANASVRLYAVPADGWSFTGWSGDATGTANPVTVVMTAAKSITATFSSAVSDIILDNFHSATFTGTWSTGTKTGGHSDCYLAE